ncbi:hypothetical protein SCLCIDRAFT_1217632 [Scleroderma citrinum Foug A]|uniref:Uncharacterized protein n=1 Tax=Scleroderma citrinum Foug A TaxID=1036808 RepID=A0A0C3DTJ1_9AGAM|nr:hypothetical protein SCLCIDRAFT_1217632 [Scleroderma citrinum Foug A]
MNSASTSAVSLLPNGAKHATSSQKDYSAAFADLQSRYGLGVHPLPALPSRGSPRSQTVSSVSHSTTTTGIKERFKWLLTRSVSVQSPARWDELGDCKE